jgi:hypothetical protein
VSTPYFRVLTFGVSRWHERVKMSGMARVHEVLHWANRRAVAEEVTRRGYRLSGETLNRWVRDEKEFPAVVERIVYELFSLDTTKEAAPRIEERLDRIEGLARAIAAATPGIRMDEVEAVVAELEQLEQQPVESPQTKGSGTRGGSRV